MSGYPRPRDHTGKRREQSRRFGCSTLGPVKSDSGLPLAWSHIAEAIVITKNISLVMLMLAGFGCANPSGMSSDEKVEARSTRGDSEKKKSQGTSEQDEGRSSRGLVTDIEKVTEQNNDFRRVIYTASHSQLVVMALSPGQHIGAETHRDVDQFLRVEEGTGEVMLGATRRPVGPGAAIVVPAGTKHDVRSTGDKPLKLYTVYSPPQHRDGIVHHTRADAEGDTEHFDGKTTE